MASDRMVSGAYKTEFGGQDEISRIIKRVEVSVLSLWVFYQNLQQNIKVHVIKCSRLVINYAALFCGITLNTISSVIVTTSF